MQFNNNINIDIINIYLTVNKSYKIKKTPIKFS